MIHSMYCEILDSLISLIFTSIIFEIKSKVSDSANLILFNSTKGFITNFPSLERLKTLTRTLEPGDCLDTPLS